MFCWRFLLLFFHLLLNQAIYTFFSLSLELLFLSSGCGLDFQRESGGRRVLLSWEQRHLWLKMSRQRCWDSNAKPWQRVKLRSHSLCLLRCRFDFSTIHLCSKRHLENIQEQHSCQKRTPVVARASWNQYKNKYHWKCFWKETLFVWQVPVLSLAFIYDNRLMRVVLVWFFGRGGVEITKLFCSDCPLGVCY